MVDVKPDEISAILKQQLSGFQSAAELEEVGSVLQVGDGIARVYGLNRAQSGELVEFENGVQAIVLNLEEDNVGVVLMGSMLVKDLSVGLLIHSVSQSMERALSQVSPMKCHWSAKRQGLSSVNR